MLRDDPSFDLFFDERTSLLEVTMVGFWSVELATAFHRAEAEAKNAMREAGRWFGEIIDSTRFPVQSAEVGAALIGVVDPTRTGSRAPTALIVSGGLSKLQAERIGAAPHIRVVQSRNEALAWIAQGAPEGWSAIAAAVRRIGRPLPAPFAGKAAPRLPGHAPSVR